MARRVCRIPGCGVISDTSLCHQHARAADLARGTRAQRGYGKEHQAARARLARKNLTCCRCGQPIAPDQDWHLDHNDDRNGYLGPAHATCNLSAAGKARWGGGSPP